MAVSANRLELLQIADAVAREKSIDKQVVIAAMEEAVQKAAKSRYGQDNEIKAEIDPKTGETRLHRLRLVVDKIENEATEITLDEAQIRNPAAQTGDLIAEPLPPIDFGRIAAQAAKQVIFQKVRDAEREKQYDEYKDRVGEIVHGTVKRVEYGNVVVDLGRGEAFVRRDELLPRVKVLTNGLLAAMNGLCFLPLAEWMARAISSSVFPCADCFRSFSRSLPILAFSSSGSNCGKSDAPATHTVIKNTQNTATAMLDFPPLIVLMGPASSSAKTIAPIIATVKNRT